MRIKSLVHGASPTSLQSIVANEKLQEEFDMNATHMLLASADLEAKDIKHMSEEMKEVAAKTETKRQMLYNAR